MHPPDHQSVPNSSDTALRLIEPSIKFEQSYDTFLTEFSAKTILRNGGKMEDELFMPEHDDVICRYWIDL